MTRLLFSLLCSAVLGSAHAQLWSTPPATAAQAVLKGFTAQGNVIRRPDTSLTLDVVANTVVGVLIESGSTEGVARGLVAAWGSPEAQVAVLKKALDGEKLQADARQGFTEASSEDGVDQLAVLLTGEGSQARWRVYVGITALPESTFPSTANVTGSPAAPNTVHILSDFQCPSCLGLWEDDVPAWRKAPGDYRVFYHHYPLSYHKNAFAAAEASECAAAQGKFWPFADALFGHFSQWKGLGAADAAGKFAAYAKTLGLDTAAFKTCQGKRTFKAEVERQMTGAQPAYLTGTPTVYLNGIKLTEYTPAEAQLIQAITRANPSVAEVVGSRLNTFRR